MADPNRDYYPLLSSNAAVVGAPPPVIPAQMPAYPPVAPAVAAGVAGMMRPPVDAVAADNEMARMRATAAANVRDMAEMQKVLAAQQLGPQGGFPASTPFAPGEVGRTGGRVGADQVSAPAMPPSNAPLSPAQAQAVQDSRMIGAGAADFGGGLGRLAAAAADVGTLPIRGVMGAVNTALRVPNALGIEVPYIPEEAFGGSSTSMTPYYDRYFGGARGGVVPTAQAATAATTPPMLASYSNEGYNRGPATQPAPASQAALPRPGGGSASASARTGSRGPVAPPPPDDGVGSWQRYAAQDRTLFDPYGNGGGAVNLTGTQMQQLEYMRRAGEQLNALGGPGGALGFRARMGALAHTVGTNNFTGNEAALESARIHAGAQLGSASIHARSAGLGPWYGYQGKLAEIDHDRWKLENTMQQGGTVLTPDPALGGMGVPTPDRGFVRNGKYESVTATQRQSQLPPGLKVGAPYKGQDGVYNVGTRKITIKGGQVAAIE